jgi:hypothetical protein
MAGDVGWHHVRRKLHASMRERERLRHRADEQRLAEPRQPFDQHVSRCRQGDQDLIDHV